MKKSLLAASCAVLGVILFSNAVPNGIAAEDNGELESVISERQYIALAKILTESKGNQAKIDEIIIKTATQVVEKGQTNDEKIQLFSEMVTVFMAAVVDWANDDYIDVVEAIAKCPLILDPADSDPRAFRVAMMKYAFASMYFSSPNALGMSTALNSVPEEYRGIAEAAMNRPVVVLGGGKLAWHLKDLFNHTIEVLGVELEETLLVDSIPVIVSTTTSTTTSTSTTTTSIPGSVKSPVPPIPTPAPAPVPTTKPSPTPVGLR